MRAIHVTSHDGPSAVEVVGVPEPAADGRVLIDVRAAGVTYPDVLQTRGEYQISPPLPFIPGAEVAGVVREAPEGSGLTAGQRVAAIAGSGGFADVVAADPRLVFALPDAISFAAAAGIPVNVLTMHFAFTRRAGLRQGETVLVHGAAGGVGIASIQLAKALGANVIAVVSTDEKAKFARDAGADETVASDGFKDTVKDLTGGRGVDMIVDPVGGDRFTDSLRCLAEEGRLLVIGFTGGAIPTVKVNRLLLNNISVVGVAWGEFWMKRVEYLAEQWAELLPLLETGALVPVIGATFPLERAAEALVTIDERAALGKIVLEAR